MKKLILSLAALAIMGISSSAMGLKEAYNALSNIPNVSVTSPDYNLPVISETIKVSQIAAAYNLDAEGILETGNAAYTILNQVPMTYMVTGVNNKQVCAFIYAIPNDSGTNDVLITVMSGYKGSAVFIYGTIDNESLVAIQNAPVEMKGSYLNITTQLPDGNDFNIILSKAR